MSRARFVFVQNEGVRGVGGLVFGASEREGARGGCCDIDSFAWFQVFGCSRLVAESGSSVLGSRGSPMDNYVGFLFLFYSDATSAITCRVVNVNVCVFLVEYSY